MYSKPKELSFSEDGIKLLKSLEGFSSKAYSDYKQYSIGYGTKAKSKTEVINEVEASKRLREAVAYFEAYIDDLVHVSLTQNMYDALVCFVYNIGENGFKNSTALREINNSNYGRGAEALLMWIKAGGKINNTLVLRRDKEKTLFLKGLSI